MFTLGIVFAMTLSLQQELQEFVERFEAQSKELADCRAKLEKAETELKLLREKKPLEQASPPEKIATVEPMELRALLQREIELLRRELELAQASSP